MSTFLCKNGVRKEYFLTPTFIIEPIKCPLPITWLGAFDCYFRYKTNRCEKRDLTGSVVSMWAFWMRETYQVNSLTTLMYSLAWKGR